MKDYLFKEHSIKGYQLVLGILVCSIIAGGCMYAAIPWTYKVPQAVKEIIVHTEVDSELVLKNVHTIDEAKAWIEMDLLWHKTLREIFVGREEPKND